MESDVMKRLYLFLTTVLLVLFVSACAKAEEPFGLSVGVTEVVQEDVPTDVPPTSTPRPTPFPAPPILSVDDKLNIAFAAEALLADGIKIDIWEIEQRGSIVYVLVDLTNTNFGDDNLDEFYAWIEHLLGLIWVTAPYSDVIVGGLSLSDGVGVDGTVQYYVLFGSLTWARTAIADFFNNPDKVFLELGAGGYFQSSSIALLPDSGYDELRGFDYEAQEQILLDQLLADAADSR
jgi:hypothetical protein